MEHGSGGAKGSYLCSVPHRPAPSEPYSSGGVIHQSDKGQTKTTHFHCACRCTSERVLFPITSLWPLWSLVFPLFPVPTPCPPFPPLTRHPPCSFSLPLACQTWETAWWLQSVESSFTCRYCLGLWCRINWRHKIEWPSEILTEHKSSRRW